MTAHVAEDPHAVLRRRRVVSAVTYVVGTAAVVATFRIEPGDARFYPAALALAAVWGVGAVASGPLAPGVTPTRVGGATGPAVQPIVRPLLLGVLLLAVFLAAAVAVARVPALREPVEGLLDHARLGWLPAVVAVTVANGVAEELYFRGALQAALPVGRAVPVGTSLYALSTVGTGVPLLVVAAVAVGSVTARQRRVSGGVLAPVVTHVTWSTGMLLLLPTVLEIGATP